MGASSIHFIEKLKLTFIVDVAEVSVDIACWFEATAGGDKAEHALFISLNMLFFYYYLIIYLFIYY